MDLNDLKQLKSLLEKLEQLESVEKLQKEVEELKEYKRRYLAIKGIIEWDEKPQEIMVKEPEIIMQEIDCAECIDDECNYGIVYTNGASYGETIRNIRKSRHQTLEEVRRGSNLSVDTIYAIENNKPRDNQSSKKKLEEYYGIKIVNGFNITKDDVVPNIIDVSGMRDTRKAKKITLKELSKMSGVPASTIHEIENNKTIRMNPVKVNKIKKALGMI